MTVDGAPPPVSGPELDDMFADGMKFLIGGGLVMGAAHGAAEMLGPHMGGVVQAAAQWEVGGAALRTAGDLTRQGPQQQTPGATGPQTAPDFKMT